MKRILWTALKFMVPLLVFAHQAKATNELHPFYSGVRCEAMGGACIAVVNDETALMVNPAALGKLRDFYGTILDPEMEGNSNLPGMYSDSAFSNPFSLEDVKGALDKNRGSYYHSKAQLFPSFVGKNFGIGLYGNSMLDAQMSSDGTKIDTYYRSDLALVLGFNFRFLDGRIKLGVNTKLIDRVEVDNKNLSATGSLDYKNIGNEGLGLSTDAGLILTAPWTYLPTVTAVIHDIGGTSFNQGAGLRMSTTGRPNTINQDIDVGAALFPIHTNYFRSSWTVQYNGLLNSTNETDKAKLIHGGLELNFGDVFFVRAGYNQRYWTAGLELASERFQWQLASYGEEIGTQSSPREDRRYTLKFAYRF
ncbi:MAG TPA: hypothetical protein VN132_13400 [Bdellovibrio sp.]|nr:hypothetical protein [Bdellovibrio sp.]